MMHGLDFDDWHTMLQDGESAQDIVQICGVGLGWKEAPVL